MRLCGLKVTCKCKHTWDLVLPKYEFNILEALTCEKCKQKADTAKFTEVNFGKEEKIKPQSLGGTRG